MEQEEWKPVVGYENNYEVSNLGRVRSLPRNGTKGGILKPGPDGKGYLQVCLCKNGGKSKGRIHILVMRAFVGKCPENHEVDHYDWNRKNNRLENLSYQPKEVNRARKSPEGLQNISEAMKKRAQDPEWQKNVREGAKKRSQDPDWRRKTAEAVRKARRKLVKQYTLSGDYVKTWASATDAAKELGIQNSSISLCCKGRYKSAGGYIWKFAV